jgi:CBS domain-containing protein
MVAMTVQALIAGKGGAVPTIKSDTTLHDVIERLERENAGALVVTDDDERIFGIITERDIARGLKTFGRNVVDKPVRELMTSNVIVCDIGEPLSKVLELMDRYQIHYVPITCAGLLCGIITMLDLVKYRLAEIEAEATALRSYIAGR